MIKPKSFFKTTFSGAPISHSPKKFKSVKQRTRKSFNKLTVVLGDIFVHAVLFRLRHEPPKNKLYLKKVKV